VFDEFADAVANSRKGEKLKNYVNEVVGAYSDGRAKTKRVVKSTDKSLEENLRILLQKGRSSGFRIIAATQRASTKVITGDAKVNFPVQVCFRVPKDIDSMVVIDEPGAEALNGRGDALIKSPEYINVVRFQGFYKE
jgi:DNA segregation ATPase FtsK/SpoIIIE-like protein